MGESGESPEPIEGQQLGFYRLERRLGRGGMGVVFRAVDTRLGRAVALKFLAPALATDERARERFLREARAAGAIDHPNVTAIYEVGEHEGLPFIAMALHEGENLKQRLARGPLAPVEAARILAQVADGLACAHARRVAHRDVKPGNIMLDGGGAVKLVDFGLAKLLDDTAGGDLTRTGELLGTLDYIAPEQHQRGEAGEAADLWAAGVVGYEMLSGKPPFHRPSTASLVTAVLTEEPAPLAADRDLETIIFKCLEKDPARRYPSAQALADDLHRFLDGEPISARRSGLGQRLGRRATRNRPALVAAVAAAVGMLALGTGWWVVRNNAADRTRRAGALGQRVQQLRTAMRSTHLLPLHDTRPEREHVRAEMREVEATERALGKEGRGPAEWALGVGHLSLGEDEEARTHLEAAWAAGERGPDLAYALGLVLGRAYQRAMQGAPPLDEAARKNWEHDLETKLRDPALAYLRAADGAADTSPAYVAALLAFYERRNDDALARAEEAFRSAPSLYEASLLMARVFNARAREKFRAGDEAGGQRAWILADAAARAAQESGRSDESVYAFYGDFMMEAAFRKNGRHEDPTDAFAATLAACDHGAQASSEATWPDALRATAYWMMGEAEFDRHRDPRARYEESVAAAQRAVARDPKNWQAYAAMGNAYGLIADRCESTHGGDPRPYLQKAIAAFEAGLRIVSDEAAWQDLGVTYASLARWQMAHGEDAAPSVEKALQAYEASVATERIEANLSYAHGNECSLLAELAGDRIQYGQDPTERLDRAAKQCALARKEDQVRPDPAANASAVGYWRALWAARTGGAADELAASALTDGEAAVKLDEKRGDLRGDLVRASSLRAELAKSPSEAKAAAARAVAEARTGVKLSDESAAAHLRLAQALLADAHVRARAHTDPSAPVAEAEKEISRSIAINATDTEALLTAAAIALAAAERARAHGQSSSVGSAALTDGKRRVEETLKINPKSVRALVLRAALERAAGDQARADATLAAARAITPHLGTDLFAR